MKLHEMVRTQANALQSSGKQAVHLDASSLEQHLLDHVEELRS